MNEHETVAIVLPFADSIPEEYVQAQIIESFQKAAEKAAEKSRVPVWPPHVTRDAKGAGLPEVEGIHYVMCTYETVEAVVP